MADNKEMADPYSALKEHKIPHEVVFTDKLVRHLMRIAETKPFVDAYLGTPQEVKLLRKAKVRAITYSNQIEGNRLGESEVTALLQGKRIAGSPKDIKEVQNYHTALDYVEQLAEDLRPLKTADICDIHRLVTQDLIAPRQCGRIRSVPVSIVNSTTGETLEVCPQPHALKDLMDDLWRWLKDTSGMNPYVRAFAFHFIAISIHPFADGNGRTIRLMQHLLLLRKEERLASFVPSETAIMRRREGYYSAIRQSRSLGQLSPILEFLAECFATSAEEIVEEGRKLLRDSAGKTPEARYRKILAHAARRNMFNMQDVVTWLPDIPRRTLERGMAALVRKRALKAHGEKKARYYTKVK